MGYGYGYDFRFVVGVGKGHCSETRFFNIVLIHGYCQRTSSVCGVSPRYAFLNSWDSGGWEYSYTGGKCLCRGIQGDTCGERGQVIALYGGVL